MIHLAFVVGIGLLIFKVIWLFFGLFERLFSRKQQVQVKQDTATKTKTSSSKPDKISTSNPSKKTGQEKTSSQIKVESQPKKQESSNIKQSEQMKKQVQPQKSKWQTSMTPHHPTSKEEQKPDRKDEKSKNSDSPVANVSSYEEKIYQLTKELQRHKKEKQQYVHKIEQIIEHIITQSQNGGESRYSTDEEQICPPISSLKNELKSAKQRVIDQRKQLTEEFEKEKKSIIDQYEIKIKKVVKKNEEKLIQYTNTIDQISKKIEEQSQQYTALLQEKSLASGDTQKSINQQLKDQYEKQSKAQSMAYEKLNEQYNKLKEDYQNLRTETQKSKFAVGKKSNDEIEQRTKLQAQIKVLQENNNALKEDLASQQQNKFKLQQQIEQINFKHQHERITSESKNTSMSEASARIDALEQNYLKEKNLREDEERKSAEILEELKFCQEQLKNARDTENDLREKLKKVNLSPPKSDRSFVRKEDVERHPEYLSLKRRLEQLQGKRPSPNPRANRQVSPSFPTPSNTSDNRNQNSPISQTRGQYRSGISNYPAFQSRTGNVGVPGSTIIADRRYNTPIEKPVAYSSIHQGGIMDEVYLGETNILDEGQRNFIIHEISAVKKIIVKKTRMIYNSAIDSKKPVGEHIISTPNMIIIAELENKKIVGGFTQSAFTKDNRLNKSSIISKAVIFSLDTRIFITNQGKGQVIRYEDNALIWGNREFVVNGEPMSISVNLNCENPIYPSEISSREFIGEASQTVGVKKLEAYRVLFG